MSEPRRRRLLVLDTSYSLEAIRANRLEASVTCRDLGGYFERVWTVHPFASLVTSAAWSPRYGSPVATELSPQHVFIEGKVGRFAALHRLAPLNLLLSQLQIFVQLVRLVHREQISVVRAGDPLVMGLYGWALARICRVPLLVRVAGNYERLRQQTGRPIMPRFLRSVRVEAAVERFVLAHADVAAAVNEDNRRYALSMGARAEHTTIFRYGNLVDPVHFSEPHTRPGGRERLAALGLGSRPVMLCLGRLEAIKMPDHAIQALALVRQQGIDAQLLMVGAGSMLGELQQLAETLSVREHVVFAGNRDQAWLAAVIPHAAVTLSPLTGRALCEVALGASPTVAYDLDWHSELIHSGQNGVLVASGDIAAMASAAARLLADRAPAVALGAELRATALAMMDQDRLDAHERSVYESLLRPGDALTLAGPAARA
jgi:glycosyltransferase involved in cell wall biosynthesis